MPKYQQHLDLDPNVHETPPPSTFRRQLNRSSRRNARTELRRVIRSLDKTIELDDLIVPDRLAR